MSEINLSDYEEFMVPDYAPLGKVFTLTITGAVETSYYDKKRKQEVRVPALAFKETPKKLKLTGSKIRRSLARLYGPESGGWINKKIGLRVAEKEMFGELGRFFEIVAPAAQLTIVKLERDVPASVSTAGSDSKPAGSSSNGNGNGSARERFHAFVKAHGISPQIASITLDETGANYEEAQARLEKQYAMKAA